MLRELLHTQREVEWRKSKEDLDQSQKLLYMTKRGVKEKETKLKGLKETPAANMKK